MDRLLKNGRSALLSTAVEMSRQQAKCSKSRIHHPNRNQTTASIVLCWSSFSTTFLLSLPDSVQFSRSQSSLGSFLGLPFSNTISHI